MENKNLDGNEPEKQSEYWKRRERKLISVAVISTCLALFLLVFGKTWERSVKVSAGKTVTAQAIVVDGMQLALLDTARDQMHAATQIADSQDRSRVALVRQLAAQAQLMSATDDSKPMLSTLLAVESMSMIPSADAAKVLLENDLVYPVAQVDQINFSSIVEFSMDGKYVISSGNYENVFRVWEVDTGRIVAEMSHYYYIRDVAVSPDGKYVVSGCEDGTVWVWELLSGKLVSQAVHGGIVTKVLFSPDGKYVISSSDDKTALIWDAKTGTEIARMRSEEYIPSVFFDADGKYMIHNASDVEGRMSHLNVQQIFLDLPFMSVSPDGRYALSEDCIDSTQLCHKLAVWDVSTGRKIEAFEQEKFSRGVFSPDGRYVALFDEDDKFLHFWEIESRKEVARIRIDNGIDALTFSDDGNYVAFSGGGDYYGEVVRVLETRNWTRIGWAMHFMQFPSMIYSIRFSPDGRYIVTGGTDFSVRVWEIGTHLDVVRVSHEAEISNFSLSADNNYMATASKDGAVRVWNVMTGREITNLIRSVEVAAVALNSNGKLLAVGRRDGAFNVWDVNARKSVFDYSNPKPVEIISFSLDDNYILAVGGNSVHLWGLEDGSEVGWFPEDFQVRYAVFSSDRRYVLTAGTDDVIRVWDIELGKEVNRINYGYSLSRLFVAPGSSGRYLVAAGGVDTVIWDYANSIEVMRASYDRVMSSVAFSSDGRHAFLLAGNIHVIEVATGREVGVMSVDSTIGTIRISPDDKYVIGSSSFDSSSYSRTAYVWSMDGFDLVARKEFNSRISAVGFSHDGKYALTVVGEDVYVWLYRPEDLIADACSRVTRDLDQWEWARYIGDAMPYREVCPAPSLGGVSTSYPSTTPTPVPTFAP